MKIRHKRSGVELEGKFAEFSHGSIYGKPRNFWIEPSNAASQYSCDDWEAVPEWVDVTRECVVYEDDAISHGNSIRFVPHAATHNYRFRKVLLRVDGLPKWAFIVERKA